MTLHSFFSSAPQPTPIRTPPKPAQIIDIGSDDENTETSPVQSKRKAPRHSDPGGLSSGSKKGKISHTTTKSANNDDSPLKSVPLSSLNRTITAVEAELYIQTNQTRKMINLAGNWEMGDDELFDILDDSQVADDEDSPGNILETCPVCETIFVDLCLSVSAVPLPSLVVHVHASIFSNCKHT